MALLKPWQFVEDGICIDCEQQKPLNSATVCKKCWKELNDSMTQATATPPEDENRVAGKRVQVTRVPIGAHIRYDCGCEYLRVAPPEGSPEEAAEARGNVTLKYIRPGGTARGTECRYDAEYQVIYGETGHGTTIGRLVTCMPEQMAYVITEQGIDHAPEGAFGIVCTAALQMNRAKKLVLRLWQGVAFDKGRQDIVWLSGGDDYRTRLRNFILLNRGHLLDYSPREFDHTT